MQIGAFESNVFGRQSKFVGDQDFSSSVKPTSGEKPVEKRLPDSSPAQTSNTTTSSSADSRRQNVFQKLKDLKNVAADQGSPSQPTDETSTDQPTEDEPKFKINPLILVGVGIAAYLFFKKRK